MGKLGSFDFKIEWRDKMQLCTLYHTGVYESANGVIKNNRVYLQGEDGQLRNPEEMFMAIEECEEGLIQFEVEGKWGFADIYSGKIIIEPVWDYAGPFYHGYAHVALHIQVESMNRGDINYSGGKHGYIDAKGRLVIPMEYDDAVDIPYHQCFKVFQNGHWGLVDSDNHICIPFEYDELFYLYSHRCVKASRDKKWGLLDVQNRSIIPVEWDSLEENHENRLLFCASKERCEGQEITQKPVFDTVQIKGESTCDCSVKWSVFDENGQQILEPSLDEKPILYHNKWRVKSRNQGIMATSLSKKYYLLKRNRRYGVLCEDGRLIEDITLYKKDAIALIDSLYKEESDEG